MSEASIQKALNEAFKKAVAKATMLVWEDAQARCPRNNGILADTLQKNENTGEVWSEQSYAAMVEYGIGKAITPKKGDILAWTKPGVTRPDSNDKEAWKSLRKRGLAVFAKSAWPNKKIGPGEDGKGISKGSFLRPAIWDNKKEILNIFKEEISNIK